MKYQLTFNPQALKEFRKLGANIANQFLDKLEERLQNPKVPSARLIGMAIVWSIRYKTRRSSSKSSPWESVSVWRSIRKRHDGCRAD